MSKLGRYRLYYQLGGQLYKVRTRVVHLTKGPFKIRQCYHDYGEAEEALLSLGKAHNLQYCMIDFEKNQGVIIAMKRF